MHTPTRQDLLDFTIHVTTMIRPLVETLERKDRSLGDQVKRAMDSASLNLAEGFGAKGGKQRLSFETARGSAYEARHGPPVAVAWGHLTDAQAAATIDALGRLAGRVHGLLGT